MGKYSWGSVRAKLTSSERTLQRTIEKFLKAVKATTINIYLGTAIAV